MLRDSWKFEYKITDILAAAKGKVDHYEKQIANMEASYNDLFWIRSRLAEYLKWVSILTARVGNPYIIPLATKTTVSKVQETLELDFEDWTFFFGEPK